MTEHKRKVGRPQEHDREAVGKALVEWAKKDDSINLNGFCITHDPLIPPSYLSIWAKDNKEFHKAYETAKAFIAVRRELKLKNNELHVKAYDLNASVYDHFLKQERRAEKEYEAGLKNAKEEESQDDLARKLLEAIKDSEGLPRDKEARGSKVEDEQPLLDKE